VLSGSADVGIADSGAKNMQSRTHQACSHSKKNYNNKMISACHVLMHFDMFKMSGNSAAR